MRAVPNVASSKARQALATGFGRRETFRLRGNLDENATVQLFVIYLRGENRSGVPKAVVTAMRQPSGVRTKTRSEIPTLVESP